MILTHLVAFGFLAAAAATGTGGGTLADVAAGGTGSAPVHGSGAAAPAAGASGAGVTGAQGSGTASAAAGASGTGVVAISGSGGGTLASAAVSGSGQVELPPPTAAEMDAIAERTVAITRVSSGPASWSAAFDPSDRAPYAMDWQPMLAAGETIADIVRLTMSAAGASLGVQIDASAGRAPVIASDGTAIQFWFLCDPAFQQDPAFTGAGVSVSVSALIRTNAVPFKDFERTALLTVRQQ